MHNIDKNNPSAEWIEQIRARFPIESEIDRILTRKLKRRGGANYQPTSLDTLIQSTESMLRDTLDKPFKLEQPRWLSGGASKLQMAFELTWHPPGGQQTTDTMVVRMEPAESITETSRLREFQVIQALKGIVPVPTAYWVDSTAEYFPYPTIIYAFARGVAKPSAGKGGVTGLGTFIPPELRPSLGDDFVRHLATTHNFDWQAANMSAFDKPADSKQALEWHLNHLERVWEEDHNDDVPLVRLAIAWLRQNKPDTDHVSLVHGDYRVGNFLFTEEDNRISAWLDWEMAYLGDRHEDLSWAAKPSFGHMHEDGTSLLVGGFMSQEAFFEKYEKYSGLSVNPKTLQYYQILNSIKAVTITLATGYRAPRNHKTHQDVLVAWLAGISYPLLEELRGQLKEVM